MLKREYAISKNLLFLGLVQGLNYLVPLVLIPILVARIGLEEYGVVALAQGLMYLFSAAADFGISITGTRMISQSTSIQDKMRISGRILQSKLYLLPIYFLILYALSVTIPAWKENSTIILYSFALVIGTALFPNWYFLGTGKTGRLALLTCLSRLVYLLSILLFVNESREAYLVNLLNGVGTLAAALVGIYFLNRDTSLLNHQFLQPAEIMNFLRENSAIFLSNLIQSGYRSSGILLAGFFLNPTALGLYGIIDKVLMMVLNGFIVIFNSVFPKVCELIQESQHRLKEFYKHFLIRLGFVVFLGSILVYLLGPRTLAFLVEDLDPASIRPYILLMALFPMLILANLPISLTLTAGNIGKAFFHYNLSALVIMLLLGITLGYHFRIYGLLTSILCTEGVTFILGLFMLYKNFRLERNF